MSKKPSLASENALIPADVASMLTAIVDPPVEVQDTSASSSPYLTFLYPLSKKWGEGVRAIADLKEGDPVLFTGTEPPVKLSPVRFFFLTGLHYWADKTIDDGKILQATLENPGRKTDLKEYFEMLAFVFKPDGSLVPARVSLNTTKCGMGKDAAEAVKDAATPEWMKKSPAHAQAAAAMPKPFMRCVHTLVTTPRTAKTGKNAGKVYHLANSTAAPTAMNDAAALKALFDTPGFGTLLAEVREDYDRRLADIYKAAGK